MLCLTGCGWFGSRRPPPPAAQVVVTGAPLGSVVYIDGAPLGQPVETADHPVWIKLPAGDHDVEIHRGDDVVYREQVYVNRGEQRIVTVLSGANR